MLTTDTESPHVAETTVSPDAAETLEVLTEGVVESVGDVLDEGAVTDVLLAVEEPAGDLEVGGVLDDVDELVDLLVGELTSTLGGIDVGLLHHDVGETTANTTNLAESVGSLTLSCAEMNEGGLGVGRWPCNGGVFLSTLASQQPFITSLYS